MKRKNVCYLAVDLIEEALEKPNKTIVLEERITKPVCEPGIKEPTKEELVNMRYKVMELAKEVSKTSMYKEYIKGIVHNEILDSTTIAYQNGSKIILKSKEVM